MVESNELELGSCSWDNPFFGLWVFFWSPSVSELSGGFLLMSLSISNILVNTEVGHKVVSWVFNLRSSPWLWLKAFVRSTGRDALHSDIRSSLSKLELCSCSWDNPLLGLWVLVRSPSMSKSSRGSGLMTLAVSNILINSEVWHKIINWV